MHAFWGGGALGWDFTWQVSWAIIEGMELGQCGLETGKQVMIAPSGGSADKIELRMVFTEGN